MEKYVSIVFGVREAEFVDGRLQRTATFIDPIKCGSEGFEISEDRN